MKRQNIVKSKKWLNPDSTSFIFTELYKETGWWTGTLKLADCSRIVSFDIDLNDKKDRKKTLKKLELMISELTNFKDLIEDAVDV